MPETKTEQEIHGIQKRSCKGGSTLFTQKGNFVIITLDNEKRRVFHETNSIDFHVVRDAPRALRLQYENAYGYA
jgi:hypothetical protein